MSFEFTDAVPVKIVGAGRKPADNPFLAVVQEIAHKTQNVDGKDVAVAKRAPVKHAGTDEAFKAEKNRIRRQLTDAGAAAKPPCSVAMNFTPRTKTESLLTIWTGPVITRTRKPKTDTSKA